MNYRTLGRTGLRVSEIGFGAWAIGGPSRLGEVEIGWGVVDDAMSLRALEAAFEAGVNFYDTSDAYGAGHSEVLIGKAFKSKRDQVVIATKVGNRTIAGKWIKEFSKPWIHEAIEASLKRLATDYVDLYQLHSPTNTADYLPEAFEALDELKAQGKIRHYGVSVGPAAHGPWVIGNTRADTIQVIYNMLDREPEKELLPLARKENVGIIARVPLASGFLTGKFTADVSFPPNDHRAKTYPPERVKRMVGQVEQLSFLTQGGRKTMAQAALQYCLADPAVSALIPGAKTPEQARANAAASDGVLLTADEVHRAREILSRS
jgi:aryl-alcohol dehydrogenase-like predicted oxidoreductase